MVTQLTLIRKLRKRLVSTGGRSMGKIATRHRGSRHYRSFYIRCNFSKIAEDFTRFTVLQIIKDPRRTSNLALICDSFGVHQYILAAEGTKVGQTIYYSPRQFNREMFSLPGTCATLAAIPTGSFIYNVEKVPDQGGIYARSAGSKAKLMIKKRLKIKTIKRVRQITNSGKLIVRKVITTRSKYFGGVLLPSKNLVYLPLECNAFYGISSNVSHKFKVIGKAGTRRNFGWRPSVRGVAMNPVDHPHGGGEGKSSTGALPRTPWGRPAKWRKTAKRSKRVAAKAFISRINKLAVSLKTKRLKSSYV